jgi:methyl-accepting chemotaxis protein
MFLKALSLKAKSSIAAATLFVLGVGAAGAIAYISIGRMLEHSLATSVAAAAREGVDVLEDVGRRMNTYADLLASRADLVALVGQRDPATLEQGAVAEFKRLNALDPSVATLEFTDAKGVIVVRGHNPAKKGDDKSKQPQIRTALAGKPAGGLTVSPTTGEAAQDGVRPLMKDGAVVGTVKVGAYFHGSTASEIKRKTGLDVIFVANGKLTANTLGKDVPLEIPEEVLATARSGNADWPTAQAGGNSYMGRFAYQPSDVGDGMVVGFLADRSQTNRSRAEFLSSLATAGAAMFVVLVPLIVFATRRSTRRLLALAETTKQIAAGNLEVDVPAAKDKDEIGEMAQAVLVFREAAMENARLEREAEQHHARAEDERHRNEAARQEAIENERAMVARSIGAALSALAAKNLTCRMTDDLPEAYSQLQMDFNEALQQLDLALQSVMGSTRAIHSGTREIAHAAADLSQRTEQQAGNLEKTTSALAQITTRVKQAAENATHAREVVARTTGDAEKSGQVVRKAVEAMAAIEKSSEQISNIISVIDEIARQTNLLALNAAVEAARAGEAGRGFAVVASEVRSLAQRSAEAAKEISGLISASTTQVGQGVALVDETGKSLERIMVQVSEINSIVSELAAGAGQQATELQQINAAINEMDQVTQKNAAMVEESTAASRSLAEETNQLTQLIGQFQVGETGLARLQQPAEVHIDTAPRPPVRDRRPFPDALSLRLCELPL